MSVASSGKGVRNVGTCSKNLWFHIELSLGILW